MDDQYNRGGVPTAGDTYSTGTTYSQGAPYTGTGTAADRPVMDRDIINEPPNTTPYPPDSGTRNPVMPPDPNNPNPVMPPEGGPTGTRNPVMPPERDTDTGR